MSGVKPSVWSVATINAIKTAVGTSGTNTGDETATRIAALNHGTTEKITLLDADEIAGQNSATSFSLIRTTWTNVKVFLKSYFDTLYVTKFKNQYTAFISQTGTNAPTVDIALKDDLAAPVWSYSAVGTYLLTKTGAFTSTKTIPNAVVAIHDNAGNKITLERTSANVMTLKTYAAENTTVLANGVITGQLINIEVYI